MDFKDLPYIYYLFLIIYCTGLTVPEVYWLTWNNMDFDDKMLNIDKKIIKKNKNILSKRYSIEKENLLLWPLIISMWK